MASNASDPLAEPTIPGFRPVPRTGVIYVLHRARERGHGSDGKPWFNLGQGSPESGELAGAPDRIESIPIDVVDQSYAPVGGLTELRRRVAEYYNQLYRRGMKSKYTERNVSIAPGGRAAMTRVVAAMAQVNLGHFIPDYTAYEELLFTFRGFIPIPILLDAASGYRISRDRLEEEIVGRGLSAVLLSNPCNPTGQVIEGRELESWVQLARATRSTFIFDEFYSHYLFNDSDSQAELSFGTGSTPPTVSAAEWIEDVDRDPVVIVNGLTKNWRYPGWRISWIVGPQDVIDQATSAGSFLDGGANRPFQRLCLDLVEPEHALREASAIQYEFSKKRDYMLSRLRQLGIGVEVEPQGSFYIWANLDRLPESLSGGHRFFEACLEERVITVPGVFFDVNPGRRRRNARYQSYSRFSFGPSMDRLVAGLDGIERAIERARAQPAREVS